MRDGRVHVIGAGLAGLAGAVELAAAGREVIVYEAAGFAGGRCRSFHDRELDCLIDNGNHLLLSGNRDALAFLERIGASGTLIGPASPEFAFMDLQSRERWSLRPGEGRLPLWIFDAADRVPGSRPGDYLRVLRLALAGVGATIAQTLDTSTLLFRRLWGPLAVAALNTEPEAASARLFWRIIQETFGRGGAACRPLVARDGLSGSFVEPALAYLAGKGASLGFGRRLRRLVASGPAIERLVFADGEVLLGRHDQLILATPASVTAELLPDLAVPQQFRAILNLHFRCEVELPAPGFVGLVGGLAEWVFGRSGTASVTVSAADRHLNRPPQELAQTVWGEVATLCGVAAKPLPPWRLIKEKRATFAATPRELARRPSPRTGWRNLVLAGDWTATGLPATIEGAVRSGRRAGHLLLEPTA